MELEGAAGRLELYLRWRVARRREAAHERRASAALSIKRETRRFTKMQMRVELSLEEDDAEGMQVERSRSARPQYFSNRALQV